MNDAWDFAVRRDDLRATTFFEAPDAATRTLDEGEVVLCVDRLAVTANTVTYGALGDAIAYWDFFPAPDGWGRIPAWGFGTVVRSRHAGVIEGERYYGYYPMSTHLVVRPGRVGRSGFLDAAPHRAHLNPLYNGYTRTASDPLYDPASEDETILLRPLFITSFVLDELFASNGFFGARHVLVSSASSKTAYGLAFLLAERTGERTYATLGLTSSRNVRFVESLGWYDNVATYDNVPRLAVDDAAYVDFSGNDAIRETVHVRFDSRLRYSIAIGYTHWDRLDATPDLPGPAVTPFFSPDAIRDRVAALGANVFAERFGAAWQRFSAAVVRDGRLRVVRGSGRDALERFYVETLAGRVAPDEGRVVIPAS